MTAPTEHPCRVTPGNTFYQFTSHRHTIGLSDRPGRGANLRLRVEETDTQVTLIVVDETGRPATDSSGATSALAIPKAPAPSPQPPPAPSPPVAPPVAPRLPKA